MGFYVQDSGLFWSVEITLGREQFTLRDGYIMHGVQSIFVTIIQFVGHVFHLNSSLVFCRTLYAKRETA